MIYITANTCLLNISCIWIKRLTRLDSVLLGEVQCYVKRRLTMVKLTMYWDVQLSITFKLTMLLIYASSSHSFLAIRSNGIGSLDSKRSMIEHSPLSPFVLSPLSVKLTINYQN